MAARKSGLGRGLDALIPQDRPTEGYGLIPVGAVDPNPNQPRTDFDQTSIDELAESIEAVGLLQPIVVRTAGDGYVLVAGERRLRAVKQLGWDDVAAVIRDETDDATNLPEALVENLQREDLSPLEEAAAYQELLDQVAATASGDPAASGFGGPDCGSCSASRRGRRRGVCDPHCSEGVCRGLECPSG